MTVCETRGSWPRDRSLGCEVGFLVQAPLPPKGLPVSRSRSSLQRRHLHAGWCCPRWAASCPAANLTSGVKHQEVPRSPSLTVIIRSLLCCVSGLVCYAIPKTPHLLPPSRAVWQQHCHPIEACDSGYGPRDNHQFRAGAPFRHQFAVPCGSPGIPVSLLRRQLQALGAPLPAQALPQRRSPLPMPNLREGLHQEVRILLRRAHGFF
jgi:hypothetical protein